jgi:hypothetical protein
MEYCEDYIDPFDRDSFNGIDEVDREDDDDHWECVYPGKCLMPFPHCRDECHTVEDAEAYYEEMLREAEAR